MQTTVAEGSQPGASEAPEILLPCPHCRTTVTIKPATGKVAVNCHICGKLVGVPRRTSARKAATDATPINREQIDDLKRCLKENESQRTEVASYINQLSIQMHRWQLRLQTLNERKEQLEKELATLKS